VRNRVQWGSVLNRFPTQAQGSIRCCCRRPAARRGWQPAAWRLGGFSRHRAVAVAAGYAAQELLAPGGGSNYCGLQRAASCLECCGWPRAACGGGTRVGGAVVLLLHDCMRLRGCCAAAARRGCTRGVARRTAEFRPKYRPRCRCVRDVDAPCALRRGALAAQLLSMQRVGRSDAARGASAA
jgi:hypothetical protein